MLPTSLNDLRQTVMRSRRQIAIVLAAGAAVLFHRTIGFLFSAWQREEYSHGWLLVLIAVFLLWQRWPQMRQPRGSAHGSWPLGLSAGVILFLVARASASEVMASWALLIVVGSILWLLTGSGARLPIGPLALAGLAIPLPEPMYSAVSSALALLSAQLGASLMRLAGTSVLLYDGILDLGTVRFLADDAVRGLNMLLPLLAIAFIATFFVRGRLWVRIMLVVSTVPLSILMNAAHLAITGVLADRYGVDRMHGVLSALDGWTLFMVCVSLLFVEAWLLLRLSGDARPLLETLDFNLVQHRPAPTSAAGERVGRRGKLLLIASNFAPELTGIGKYMGDMSAWLAQAGFEIRIVTAPPYYPAWRVLPGYSSRHYMTQYLGGIRVIRCPLLVPRRPGGVSRILHMLSFAASTFPVVLWQCLAWRPQMVFVVEPPLACTPAALLGARLAGARAWLHVQDFEVDAAFQLGILKNAALQRAALAAERWLMRRFDGVSSISPRMLRKLLRKGVDRTRIRYFPNWVDTTAIRPVDRLNRLRGELGIGPEQYVLLYSGNMGEKQGLELLVEVARQLLTSRPAALFLLCGDGAAKLRIMEAAKGMANVRFVPLQPLSRLNDLLSLADVHLVPQRADAEDLVMPSKLTAILASGRPVVASARPATDLGRAAATGGLVVPPGEPQSFADALCRLLDDPGLCQTLSDAGRAYAISQWDRDVVLGNAARELDVLLGQSMPSIASPAAGPSPTPV